MYKKNRSKKGKPKGRGGGGGSIKNKDEKKTTTKKYRKERVKEKFNVIIKKPCGTTYACRNPTNNNRR